MESLKKEHERLDDLELKGLKIIQDPEKFCFGMDAVILSDFAKIRKNAEVLDFCTGTGIIPLLLSAKYEPRHIRGVEYQEDMAEMAGRSVRYNHLEEKIEICHGDIRRIKNLVPAQSVDAVTCNPPYMEKSSGLHNEKSALCIARHEVSCTLEDVVSAAAYVLKQGGRLYMVHRPHRMVAVMDNLKKYKMEAKRMRFVHPFADREANMLLVEAVKGGGSWLRMEAPLIVYREDGSYTDEILRIHGKC